MNTWQVVRQLKFLLEAQKWTGTSNEVFAQGHVKATSGLDEQTFINKLNFPCVLIQPGNARPDPEEQGFVDIDIGFRLAVKHSGDAIGEGSLIGNNRPDQEETSRGRGLLELEEMLFDAVGKLTDLDGIRIIHLLSSATRTLNTNSVYIAQRDYLHTVTTTMDKFYHPPYALTATINGADVDLTWTLPAVRYDTRRVMVRRIAGTAFPTETTGTEVPTTATATSVTDTAPASGDTAYGIFEVYDEFDEGSDQQFSDAGVFKTVTVP